MCETFHWTGKIMFLGSICILFVVKKRKSICTCFPLETDGKVYKIICLFFFACNHFPFVSKFKQLDFFPFFFDYLFISVDFSAISCFLFSYLYLIPTPCCIALLSDPSCRPSPWLILTSFCYVLLTGMIRFHSAWQFKLYWKIIIPLLHVPELRQYRSICEKHT